MLEKEQQALEEVVALDDPAPAVAAAKVTRLTAQDVIAPDDVEEGGRDGTGFLLGDVFFCFSALFHLPSTLHLRGPVPQFESEFLVPKTLSTPAEAGPAGSGGRSNGEGGTIISCTIFLLV